TRPSKDIKHEHHRPFARPSPNGGSRHRGLQRRSLGVVRRRLRVSLRFGSNTLPVSSARTPAWSNGTTVTVQYPQNYFCDRTVTAVPLGATGCEVGAPANVGPVANPDRSTLYVVIPLFANPNPATMCPTAT